MFKFIDKVSVVEMSFFGCNALKCSGSCNDINDPYAKVCVRYASKNMIVKYPT